MFVFQHLWTKIVIFQLQNRFSNFSQKICGKHPEIPKKTQVINQNPVDTQIPHASSKIDLTFVIV